MKKFQEKKQLRRVIYSKGMIIFILIVLFFLGRAVVSAYQKYSLTQKNEAAAVAQYEEFQNRKETLEAELEKLKTTRGVEEALREKFNVAKPGEGVVNITE
ncbi:MAG TPA: septum formation initiator family protein [Candidatus Paceibacterota bacterium]